jgi:hypothetical protein
MYDNDRLSFSNTEQLESDQGSLPQKWALSMRSNDTRVPADGLTAQYWLACLRENDPVVHFICGLTC